MISKVPVCLEVGTQATSAFAPEYPGCWVFGKTEKSALQKVRIAIIEWIDWQKSHGESVPDISSNAEAEVTEMLRVDYNPVEAGKPEPLFWSEVAPITKRDISKTIRLMNFSRSDLLATVTGLTDDCLDWEPPGKPRTIRNCLMHIANVEMWYITRLNIKVPEEFPETPIELLDYSREIVFERLQNFPERKIKGVFQPRKYKSPVCNLWTARKVLRRLVDHERLHTKYIKKVLDLHKAVAKD